eukprot:3789917-Pleurochrysis_carterae.AAC.3
MEAAGHEAYVARWRRHPLLRQVGFHRFGKASTEWKASTVMSSHPDRASIPLSPACATIMSASGQRSFAVAARAGPCG